MRRGVATVSPRIGKGLPALPPGGVPGRPERGCRYFLSLALNNRFQKDFFCGSSPVPLGCAAPP